GRREADEAEEPPLPASDLEERQRDRLRPDLLVARHRARAVEADDHRAAAALVGAAERVREEAALDQAAGEVAAQERVVEREQLGAGGRRHLAETLGHLLGLLAEPRLGHPCGVGGALAHPARGGLALLGQAVDVCELLTATAELVLAPLEVPEVEEVAARQEGFLAQHGEHLLGDQQRAEARLGLVELRPLAQVLEQRMAVEGLEERAAERRGRRDRLGWPETRLELEKQAEDVLEQRPE